MFLAGLAVADHDLWQPVLALQPQEMAGIGHVADNKRAGLVGDHFAPVFLHRIVDRRFHDLEILGAAVIGEDVEDVAALGQRIFDAFLARRHQLRLGGQVLGRQQPVFAGLVVVDVDIDDIVEQRAADAHEEAGIGFLIDQPVFRLRLAENVVEHLRWPVILVECRIEEALAIRRPDAAAAGILDPVLEVLSGLEVAHLQREELRTLVVITPDAAVVVARVVEA